MRSTDIPSYHNRINTSVHCRVKPSVARAKARQLLNICGSQANSVLIVWPSVGLHPITASHSGYMVWPAINHAIRKHSGMFSQRSQCVICFQIHFGVHLGLHFLNTVKEICGLIHLTISLKSGMENRFCPEFVQNFNHNFYSYKFFRWKGHWSYSGQKLVM